MSVQELEQAVTRLSSEELDEFIQWCANYQQNAWDKQILEDIKAGRLNKLIQRAHQDFETGQYRTL